jgi:hypothetical protein
MRGSEQAKRLRRCRIAAGLWLATVVASTAAAAAGGVRITVSSQLLLARQGVHAFTIRVRDTAGQPVENARVSLRLQSFSRSGYRSVTARHTGAGRYHAVAHLRPGVEDPRYVRVIVEPAGSAGSTSDARGVVLARSRVDSDAAPRQEEEPPCGCPS